MDIKEIQEKLDALKNVGKNVNKASYEKVDYTKYFWKPAVGKQTIRFVPSAYNSDGFPFQEVFVHYKIARFPIYALSNWGESDPIVEFAEKLKSSRTGDRDKDKQTYLEGKRMLPKMRVYAPVIIRGQEDKGVLLWEFGKNVYEELLEMLTDEDYNGFYDIVNGRDFTITGTKTENMGITYISPSLLIKPKTTKLSEDPSEVEKWTKEQPELYAINPRMDYDTMKDHLVKYLSTMDEGSTENETSTQYSKPKPKDEEPESISKSTNKKSDVDKFNALFEQ